LTPQSALETNYASIEIASKKNVEDNDIELDDEAEDSIDVEVRRERR